MESTSDMYGKLSLAASKVDNCGLKNVNADTEKNNDFHDSDPMADNGSSDNYITYESMDGVAESFMHDAKYSSGGDLVSALVPRMENLELSQKAKPNEPECLAGYIKAVIPPTGTVVIQLASGSKILDVGTAIFVQKNAETAGKHAAAEEYSEIGFISDIFGSVFEPMYSLQLKQRVAGDSLRMDAKVFYSRNHASTRYISVVHDDNDRYIVMQN